jgi:tRNA(adenine34) deaminase
MDDVELDEGLMSRALGLAQAAKAAGEVPVGALIYDPEAKRIIAEAANAPITDHDPTAHAEIKALRMAGKVIGNYRLSGLWLYVTLEPCAMCAGAIAHARIERLIFGASDPKGGAVISGPQFFEQPTCHWHPQVKGGVLADQSSEALRAFFKEKRKTKAQGRV